MVLNLTGQRFGRLVAVEVTNRNNGLAWRCKCDCGNWHTAPAKYLRSGNVMSCGCLRAWSLGKHRMSHTRTYQIWKLMLARCRAPRGKRFERYGKRGIRVCPRWESFQNFLNDMGYAPDGLSIERVNNDKGYSPGNCVWANQKTQSRNRRTNHMVTISGKTRPIAEWAEILNQPVGMVYRRIYRGWDAERALLAPKGSTR